MHEYRTRASDLFILLKTKLDMQPMWNKHRLYTEFWYRNLLKLATFKDQGPHTNRLQGHELLVLAQDVTLHTQ